jgi:hypothetical protein
MPLAIDPTCCPPSWVSQDRLYHPCRSRVAEAEAGYDVETLIAHRNKRGRHHNLLQVAFMTATLAKTVGEVNASSKPGSDCRAVIAPLPESHGARGCETASSGHTLHRPVCKWLDLEGDSSGDGSAAPRDRTGREPCSDSTTGMSGVALTDPLRAESAHHAGDRFRLSSGPTAD